MYVSENKTVLSLSGSKSRRALLAQTLALLMVGALGLAGCPSNNSGGGTESTTTGGGTTGTAASSGGKKIRLAFVTNNASDFWTIARKGTEKAASELPNAEVEVKIPAEGTAADQQRVVNDLLAKGVDGVAISPVDPANQTDMLNNIAEKALLVTQDSDAPDSKRACYIGTDNVAAGRQAGELIKEALPQGGKIMLFVGKKDAQNAKERAQGIAEALKGTKVQIIDTRTDDTDRAKAVSNVSDTLVKYPDIAACVGLWSYNGPAIYKAVKDGGKADKVKIVCFDEEDDTLAGVKDGTIYGTIVQQPYEFGYQSVKAMADAIQKGKDGKPDMSGFPADKKIIVKTLAIKKADVDAFAAKLKEQRGK